MASLDEPVPLEPLEVVETPTSPSSGLALSRFEFETGKGNDGTKVLMVEWDATVGAQMDPSQGQELPGSDSKGDGDDGPDWEVSWEGKTTTLQVRDTDPDAGSNIRRVYYLLLPGVAIPTLVSISRKRGADTKGTGGEPVVLRTMPMPAIFPVELIGGEGTGRRGVLHSIWAKRRLAELDAEIAAEMKANGESVGLEMAIQERQWIVNNFELSPEQGAPRPTKLQIPQTPITSPASPRSPLGGRLGEKLRGLKLATSPAELAAATQASKSALPQTQTLRLGITPNNSGPRVLQKDTGSGGVASLDAIVGSRLPHTGPLNADENTEEELFALPMSPRSPEMKRSPFSLL